MRVAFLLFLFCEVAYGQADSAQRSTNAVPPKFTPDYIARINLASEVPNPPEAFRYQVTGEMNGTVYYTDKIPLFEFVNSESGKAKIGEVAVGSAITLDKIAGYAGRMYYGVDVKVKVGANEVTKVGWLDGMFIKIAGTN